MTSALVSKLQRRDDLSDAEIAVLNELCEEARSVPAGHAIVHPGDRPGHSTIVISGFCARYATLTDGGRQFTEINVSGDFVDLHSFLLKRMDHGVLALSDMVISNVPHSRLKRLTEEQPHLTRLFWMETVIDAAIHRQWLLCMGRLSARARFAHLICELSARLEAAKVSDGLSFELPVTQVEMADFLGVSPVHVNRVLMEVRAMGLMEWRGGRVQIFDAPGLAVEGQFDPVYLRLQKEPV